MQMIDIINQPGLLINPDDKKEIYKDEIAQRFEALKEEHGLPHIRLFLSEFIAHLRSGKYEQAIGSMRDGQKICAGGLLTDMLACKMGERLPIVDEGIDLTMDADKPLHQYSGNRGINKYIFFPLLEVYESQGLGLETVDDFGNLLFRMNHIDTKSLDQIADYIETTILPLMPDCD